MIKVRVPATTANMGPGFDTLGCALTLYNEFEVEISEGLFFDGCDEIYWNEENLFVVAYKKTLEKLNIAFSGVNVSFSCNVPVSRGLGSSSTLIVGGAMAANSLYGNQLSKAELLAICNEIEGHPDNVAPAIYGGLCASLVKEKTPYTLRYDINPAIRFCVMIPDFKTSTHQARRILPETIAFKDAVFNLSHVALLCKALELKDEQMIQVALEDMLHQPYRKNLIVDYDKIKNTCMENGAYGFFISGSGPVCIALFNEDSFIPQLRKAFTKFESNWQIVELHADLNGATIVEGEEELC